MATKGIVSVEKPKAPKTPKQPKAPKPPTANAHGPLHGQPRLPPLPSTTPPPATTTTTVAFKPDAAWWTAQFAADPRWMQSAPGFKAAEEGTAAKYGYQIARSPSGQTLFKSKSTKATGITQVLDANGNPVLDDKGAFVYKDAAGTVYAPSDLEMDIRELKPGEAGYLEGQLGYAAASSANRQQQVGEAAAQAGARRSGMRAYGAAAETQALQGALRNLGLSAASEFGGLSDQQRNLFNSIYGDLLKVAGSTPGTTVETPVPPTTTGGGAGGGAGAPTMPGVPQEPLEAPKSINIAGQTVTFPKGINLAGVDVRGIGRRIAQNVQEAGGVKKLKNGQKVGQFAAGGKGYWVVYRGGKFVIEGMG